MEAVVVRTPALGVIMACMEVAWHGDARGLLLENDRIASSPPSERAWQWKAVLSDALQCLMRAWSILVEGERGEGASNSAGPLKMEHSNTPSRSSKHVMLTRTCTATIYVY